MENLFDNLRLYERSYGGAFDIEDDQFFTREDINEFADEVLEQLSDLLTKTNINRVIDVQEIYVDNNQLQMTIISDDEEFTYTATIDMRRIRLVSDLIKKYSKRFIDYFLKEIKNQK